MADVGGAIEVDGMLDQDADVVGAVLGPGGFDFAQIEGVRGLKLHESARGERVFAFETGFGDAAFERKQLSFDRQLRAGDRG